MESDDKIRIFTDKIHKMLQPFEKERKRRLCILILRQIIVFIVLAFLIKFFIICMYDSDAAFWFFVMILGVLYYIFYDFIHTNKLFKTFIKSKCKNIVDEFISTTSDPISKNELNKSNLFGYFEYVNVDDGFCGTYNGVDYNILETSLTGKSSKGFDIQVFKGLVAEFEFNKKILKDTIITRKYDDNIRQNLHLANLKRIFIPLTLVWLAVMFPFAYMTFSDGHADPEIILLLFAPLAFWVLIFGVPMIIMHIVQQRKNKMEKTEMEDIVFSKDYIVHTKDALEARYLITTAFIERYLNLQKIFKTKNIKCSFYNKTKIMFAIPTGRDLFEFGSLYTSLKDKKHIEKFYSDITEILKIIDVLKLNQKLGL